MTAESASNPDRKKNKNNSHAPKEPAKQVQLPFAEVEADEQARTDEERAEQAEEPCIDQVYPAGWLAPPVEPNSADAALEEEHRAEAAEDAGAAEAAQPDQQSMKKDAKKKKHPKKRRKRKKKQGQQEPAVEDPLGCFSGPEPDASLQEEAAVRRGQPT